MARGGNMNKVEERNPLESLKEEIRIFKKNEEATYDMLALYELLLQDIYVHSLIGITLTEKVIHDLEDPEVTIPFRAKYIAEFLSPLTDKLYEILRKYEKIEECTTLCSDFCASYKERIAAKDFSSILYRKDYDTFNLMQQLLSSSPAFVYKFLVSEISLQTRLEMFAFVLGAYSYRNFRFFVEGPKQDYLSKEEYNKYPEKIQEILALFNNNECKLCKVKDLINHLLKEGEYETIRCLQNYGIDFNGCYWNYCSEKEPNLNNKTISTVGALFNYERSLSSIQVLYEAESYLKVDRSIRDNDDKLILHYLSSSEICDFIKWPHFEITEEKIRFLASKRIEDLKACSNLSLKEMKEQFEAENKEIAEAIIHKTEKEEEFEQMTAYANLFMELTDIDKEINRLEEAGSQESGPLRERKNQPSGEQGQ